MLNKEITFDRFIRGALVAAGATAAVMLINRLSDVLLPFFAAWLIAYMLFPLVRFLQYRCRLRHRVLCIVLALLMVLMGLAVLIGVAIPPTIQEFSHLQGVIVNHIRQIANSEVANQINDYLREYITQNSFFKIIQEKSFLEVAQAAFGQMWSLVSSAINMLVGLLGATVVLLYIVFILLDYERISAGWIRLVPHRQRPFAAMVVRDVEHGMNAYFRGQALVAMCVGILFSIGFSIIGFPLAIGLGLFVGVLNLVPYLQIAAFVPTILLALLKSSQTGQNFWWILLPALAVFLVVQAIQDFYLVPRIMGRVMGLNPAIILLSLSIWGSLLGVIGLIIALPLTTLLLSYYRRFVLEETDETEENMPADEKK